MNTFGNIYRLTTYGESHGAALGGVIDGMPAGIDVDTDFIQAELERRRPGQGILTTARKEADRVELLSGIFEGKTTGTPIGFIVRNTDHHSADYSTLKDIYRPSHADYTYQTKYGIRDYRGGGRTSARETLCRVVGGAFAKLALNTLGVEFSAQVSQVGNQPLNGTPAERQAQMEDIVTRVRAAGDSIGGIISCTISHCPAGLGEPVFGKLNAALAGAMLSINAAKGFDLGGGFNTVGLTGSQMNDEFYTDPQGNIHTRTNYSGGIQGGISNGEDIQFRVLFKPVPTIMQPQHTVDTEGNEVEFTPHGRHDPCVLTRAVPIVEAMAAMVVLDYYLLNKTTKLCH
ncbi:MAG: chorismate synthase [Bacteroidaceae bacterium]|nr:chorismate synthase [Bacteroidaceae bacterium]MBQ9176871.1 chorismate synthase [Bacteroidaceae bacterium]